MDLYPNLRAVIILIRTNYFINIVVKCMDLNYGIKLVQRLKQCILSGERHIEKF